MNLLLGMTITLCLPLFVAASEVQTDNPSLCVPQSSGVSLVWR